MNARQRGKTVFHAIIFQSHDFALRRGTSYLHGPTSLPSDFAPLLLVDSKLSP